jgi:hypothetical protein
MNRLQRVVLRVLAVGSLVVGAGVLSGCYGEVEAGPAYYPPPAYVASVQPVYYGGRPVYCYGNRWYYREGGAWAYYRTEPGYLAGRRPPPPRYGYGRRWH